MGCTLYEMANLAPPFTATSMAELAAKIVNGEPPAIDQRYSAELADLYQLMMRKNPAERPGTHAILSHPLIRFHAAELMEQAAVWTRTGFEEAEFTVPFPRVRPDSFCLCGAKERFSRFFTPVDIDPRYLYAVPQAPRDHELPQDDASRKPPSATDCSSSYLSLSPPSSRYLKCRQNVIGLFL